MPSIRPKAVCVFRRGNEILVIRGYDDVKDEGFFIPPGGGIEFREYSCDAARREVREELGVDVEEPKLLGVFENVFEYRGRSEHEIIFAYQARFTDSSLYERSYFPGVESNGVQYVAEWVGLEFFDAPGNLLFPNGLFAVLRG